MCDMEGFALKLETTPIYAQSVIKIPKVRPTAWRGIGDILGKGERFAKSVVEEQQYNLFGNVLPVGHSLQSPTTVSSATVPLHRGRMSFFKFEEMG